MPIPKGVGIFLFSLSPRACDALSNVEVLRGQPVIQQPMPALWPA